MPEYVSIPPGAIKIDLPNTTQLEDYNCGPAALLAICAYYDVGPEHEADAQADMKSGESGSDPEHIIRAAERYGLTCEPWRAMTNAQLTACLDQRHPVMVMLQAWGEPRPPGYAGYSDGHWIVAIGYDDSGVYFEDPSIYRRRGFLTYDELSKRWHDLEGDDNHPTERYGLAIWKAGFTRYSDRARRIE